MLFNPCSDFKYIYNPAAHLPGKKKEKKEKKSILFPTSRNFTEISFFFLFFFLGLKHTVRASKPRLYIAGLPVYQLYH